MISNLFLYTGVRKAPPPCRGRFPKRWRAGRYALGMLALLVNMSSAAGIEVNRVFEWSIRSTKSYADPFNEVEVDVLVSDSNGGTFKVPAFWSGSDLWRARVSFSKPGNFTLRALCSDSSNHSLTALRTNVTVVPYPGTNHLYRRGKVEIAADKKHFKYADGTPFLWLGDTWWMGLTRRLKWDEFKELTNDRVTKDFNTIQIVAGLYPDMPAFDERGLGDGGFPWATNYSTINPTYFDEAEKRVQHLCNNGLMPCIVGAWAYHLPWLGVERMKKHWRNVVARWGAYPVVWCVAGEGAMPYYLSDNKERDRAFQIKGWTDVARYIRQIDGHGRLITIHPTDFSRSQVEDASVIDFEMLQTGHGDRGSIPNTIETLRKTLAMEPRMPVINSEVCYEGIGGTCHDDVQRFFVWSCLLSGAAGHTYGANGIWQVNRREQPYGKSPHGGNWGTTPWDDAMRLPGSRQTGLARKLLEKFEWWKFEPHPEWATWDANTTLPKITWGDWIWFPEGDPAKNAPAEEPRFFRARFTVAPDPVRSATLRVAADDKCIVYLNGERIGSHNTWRTARELNVTKRLKPGENVVAVRAENVPAPQANPAGLLCGLELVGEHSARTLLVSDAAWRVSNIEQPGWTNLVFDDSAWKSAKIVARYGDKPWEKIPGPEHRKYAVPYAAGIPAMVRVFYLPEARRVVVRSIEPNSNYRARWFDPVTGAETGIGTVKANERGEWTPPVPPGGEQDWVLVLSR